MIVATHSIPELVLTDHKFTVPADYNGIRSDGERILDRLLKMLHAQL